MHGKTRNKFHPKSNHQVIESVHMGFEAIKNNLWAIQEDDSKELLPCPSTSMHMLAALIKILFCNLFFKNTLIVQLQSM